MDDQDGGIFFFRLAEIIEIGQLGLAGGAPGGPQIDEGDLAPGVRQMEFRAVVAGQGEIRQLLAGFVADGGAARPVRRILRRDGFRGGGRSGRNRGEVAA